MADGKRSPGRWAGAAATGGGLAAAAAWGRAMPLVAWVAVAVVILVFVGIAAVVVLTAARGRDPRQQRNSAAVLDRLLAAARRSRDGRG